MNCSTEAYKIAHGDTLRNMAEERKFGAQPGPEMRHFHSAHIPWPHRAALPKKGEPASARAALAEEEAPTLRALPELRGFRTSVDLPLRRCEVELFSPEAFLGDGLSF